MTCHRQSAAGAPSRSRPAAGPPWGSRRPGDQPAQAVADYDRVGLAQRPDQPGRVGGGHQVIAAGRLVAAAVAAQAHGDRAAARAGQGGEVVPPGPPEHGEAVQEQYQRSGRRPRRRGTGCRWPRPTSAPSGGRSGRRRRRRAWTLISPGLGRGDLGVLAVVAQHPHPESLSDGLPRPAQDRQMPQFHQRDARHHDRKQDAGARDDEEGRPCPDAERDEAVGEGDAKGRAPGSRRRRQHRPARLPSRYAARRPSARSWPDWRRCENHVIPGYQACTFFVSQVGLTWLTRLPRLVGRGYLAAVPGRLSARNTVVRPNPR
jgi:hypothetical protein